jgi:DNA-binding response OmpR family regulator
MAAGAEKRDRRRFEFRVEEFERLLRMHPDMVGAIQKATGLSTRPACIVAALARRPGNVITKENILDLLYAGMPDQPEMKIIDVFICKARAKLTPHKAGSASLPRSCCLSALSG